MRSLILTVLAVMMAGSAWAENVIVTQAQSYIGQGETCGDNCGKFVQKVLDDERRLPWCAGFVSYVLQETDRYNNMPYILRAMEYLKYGKKVSNPMAGDIVIWSRGNGAGHVGIVKSVEKGYFESIEGNTGKYPSKVKVLRHNTRDSKILGFRRLKNT